MKIKCPECEATMVQNEDEHVCESCDHTIALTEAEELFESGDLIGILDESDDLDENEDLNLDEDQDEDLDESFNGFASKETWAAAVISENEYDIYKQIKSAHKKEKLDEKFIKTLVENQAKVEGDELFENIDMESVDWTEVTDHFTSAMVESDKISVDVTKVLFADVELNEEQKDEVATIFETAVDIRVNEIKSGLLEDHENKLEEAIEAKTEELEASTAEYVDHVVENWYEDNEIAITDSLKVEYAEDFIDRLHDLFTEHYVHVPEDRFDIIESLNEKVNKYEEYETYAIEENEKLENTITEMKKETSLSTLTEGMVETEKERLVEIAEKVDYKDEESFLKEVTKLKEAFISKGDLGDKKDDLIENDKDRKPSISDDIAAAALG